MNTVPNKPPNRPSDFYKSIQQIRRIEDYFRLVREAERIAAAYAAKRWGQEVEHE